ncbi:MAG: hypothetical protein JWN04_4159 [Myxococcaceae bacterium]|nr:hypothetical protein [Myxococcaceae bacterium]
MRRKSLVGFRAACEQMWGVPGMDAITRELPADTRERTAGLRPMAEWLPLEDLIAWHVVVWNGPAKRDEAIMRQHAHLTVDQGFGRVKRFVIGALTPESLATRVVALWGDEYSTGRLEARSVEPYRITLALTDHAYVEHPLMRSVIAEVYRYVLSMTRARNVTVVHARRDASLIVTLRWE